MMADDCGRSFDESLLTGYLDGVLTQADEQRVRVHVEECGTCRTALDEMLQLREVTTNAEFQVPADDQWSEQARSRASGLSMGLGWTIVVVWLAGLVGYATWELVRAEEPLLAKLLAFGAWSGFSLLLLGVALDRLKAMKTDRYREVKR